MKSSQIAAPGAATGLTCVAITPPDDVGPWTMDYGLLTKRCRSPHHASARIIAPPARVEIQSAVTEGGGVPAARNPIARNATRPHVTHRPTASRAAVVRA